MVGAAKRHADARDVAADRAVAGARQRYARCRFVDRHGKRAVLANRLARRVARNAYGSPFARCLLDIDVIAVQGRG